MENKINEDEPLDPVMEKVRVKMVRLLGISIGLMLLALITVLGAVVYKISQGSQEAEGESEVNQSTSSEKSILPFLENLEVDLPEGARVVSSSLSNNNIMLDLRMVDGGRQFWILDLSSGKIISRITSK